MSIVVTNIGSIPKSGFDWYITFLEVEFEPKIKQEIETYFNEFGKAIGTKALAIRGYDPKNFRESVFEANALYGNEWREKINTTSLIITNKSPEIVFSSETELRKSKIIILPLTDTYNKNGTLRNLLKDLSFSILNGVGIEAIEKLEVYGDGFEEEKNFFMKAWDWLSKYSEMKPGFFGFNLDIKLLANKYIFNK